MKKFVYESSSELFNDLSPIPMKGPIDLGDGRIAFIVDWVPDGRFNSIDLK